MTDQALVIGADYGTNSARYIVANAITGKIIAEHVYDYEGGEFGIILNPANPVYARQDPNEYFKAFHACMDSILKQLDQKGFDREDIVGIGTDTTGSTPIPVDSELNPIGNAWLWKDKTSAKVANSFNILVRDPLSTDYTRYTGGLTSPEWILSKVIQLAIEQPKQFRESASFVEHCDLMPAWMAGQTNPQEIYRSRCAAGHKAHFHEDWAGLPSQKFISQLGEEVGIRDSRLDNLIERLYTLDRVVTADKPIGYLKKELAQRYGLNDNVAIAAGAFDAHMGAVGVGIKPGVLSKIMGTSTCDMLVSSVDDEKLIPGICGQVRGSIIPGMVGYEAGQSSAGDTLAWFRNLFLRSRMRVDDDKELRASDRDKSDEYAFLERNAAGYGPKFVNILASDYFNGIRTPDVDPGAYGMLLGLRLTDAPGKVYRALIEAVAYGANAIINRITENRLDIDEVIACGGLTSSDLVMQLHADITGKPFRISSVKQTCALGAAMFAAVAAGIYDKVEDAQAAMNPVKTRFAKTYTPDMQAHQCYDKKFLRYKQTREQVLPMVKTVLR